MNILTALFLSRSYTRQQSVHIGSVEWTLSTVIPSGYLQFDGTTYTKSEYPKLYAVLPAVLKNTENETFTLPDLSKRVPQIADMSNIGQFIEAGLPNIIGSFGIVQGRSSQSGAFYNNGNTNNSYWNSDNQTCRVGFKASNGETKADGTLKTDESTKVFGKSDTVQPSAFTFALIIRAK